MSHYIKNEKGRLQRVYTSADRHPTAVVKGSSLGGSPLEFATNFEPQLNSKGTSTESRGVSAELSEWAQFIGRGGPKHLPLALTVARAALMVKGTPKEQFDKGFATYNQLFTRYAKQDPKSADQLLLAHQEGQLPYGRRNLKMHEGALDDGPLLKAFRRASLPLHSADVRLIRPQMVNQQPVAGMNDPVELAVA